MSAKKNTTTPKKQPVKAVPVAKPEKSIPKQAPADPKKSTSFNKLLLVVLVIITTAIYYKSLNNKLTNWDDKGYVTDNSTIKTLHGDSVGYTVNYLFHNYAMGNYHPLTMLSYSMEYSKYQLAPKPYHVTNLIIHLLNVLLVFFFIWLLVRQQWVAFITALLFAIHPMHVESVAWVSERKDVLYAFFYLAGLCTYLLYLNRERGRFFFYLLAIVVFVLADLSKGMAVSLPIALFAIDYFKGRKISFQSVIDKVPFLVIALIFGLIAVKAQVDIHAVGDTTKYALSERIMFTSYGAMMYLWKFIAPFDLSCFYGYPTKGAGGYYPILFYIAPFVMVALLYFIYRSVRKGKTVLFGIGFFFITIALVLQFLPVGEAILAERYTYLPYIGISFIVASWIQQLMDSDSEKLRNLKTPVILLGCLVAIGFSVLSFNRTKIWSDSLSLWNDAIKKNPDVPRLYQSRGDAYTELKDYKTAVKDYDRAIELNQYYPDALYNRGIAHYYLLHFDQALADYNLAIQYKDTIRDAYYNRGITFQSMKRYDEAIKDFTVAIDRHPDGAFIYNNRGLAYFFVNKYDEALKDYTDAIKLRPDFAEAYNNRAGIWYSKKRFDLSLEDALNSQKYGYGGINPKFIEELEVLTGKRPAPAAVPK